MEEIEKITEIVENTPKQSIDNLFDYLYAEQPKDIENQKNYIKNIESLR